VHRLPRRRRHLEPGRAEHRICVAARQPSPWILPLLQRVFVATPSLGILSTLIVTVGSPQCVQREPGTTEVRMTREIAANASSAL
jgi:hypothetical protein